MDVSRKEDAAKHADGLRSVVRGLNETCENYVRLLDSLPAGSSVHRLVEDHVRVLAAVVNVVAPAADFLTAEAQMAFVGGEVQP